MHIRDTQKVVQMPLNFVIMFQQWHGSFFLCPPPPFSFATISQILGGGKYSKITRNTVLALMSIKMKKVDEKRQFFFDGPHNPWSLTFDWISRSRWFWCYSTFAMNSKHVGWIQVVFPYKFVFFIFFLARGIFHTPSGYYPYSLWYFMIDNLTLTIIHSLNKNGCFESNCSKSYLSELLLKP